MQNLASAFAKERTGLEQQWTRRQCFHRRTTVAFQRYRHSSVDFYPFDSASQANHFERPGRFHSPSASLSNAMLQFRRRVAKRSQAPRSHVRRKFFDPNRELTHSPSSRTVCGFCPARTTPPPHTELKDRYLAHGCSTACLSLRSIFHSCLCGTCIALKYWSALLR